MKFQSPYHTFKRYQTLRTNRISALPIVILMPHSACNCRCVMCDIWKDNRNLKQLTEHDVRTLMTALERFGTRQVLMSGGEPLLNPRFFDLCRILKKRKIRITLLSTGLALKKNAEQILQHTDDVIVSLDGAEAVHDALRNIPGAYSKLKEGVHYLKSLKPSFPVTGRTVIHRINFRSWHQIIEAARDIKLDSISFLPADVSSTAFNRETVWNEQRQHEVALSLSDLDEFEGILSSLIDNHKEDFEKSFIAESPEKLHKILRYYRALHGLDLFPFKKCNAPWVSAVVEADGSVRPCFFHDVLGNIREDNLAGILNSRKALKFRKELNMEENETCRRCVCYLHLSPHQNIS